MASMKRPAFLPDDFTLMLVATVVLATLLPAQGAVARFFDGFTSFAIGLLFFLHGAKLSREAIRAGATHWRLHVLVFTYRGDAIRLISLRKANAKEGKLYDRAKA